MNPKPCLRSGYRQYPPSAIIRDRGGAPCRHVRAMAEAKLREIEAQLTELAGVRDQLRSVLEDWDRRLADTPEGQPARLLEALKGVHA